MTESKMTPEVATALRKPFPKESVGKLPKGGTLLDYVGHAAVTDRLLTVDPEWSWEPLALDEHGLPALDKGGNLWIKLTICGVTRLGVGDGKSAKEAIGDAIRNAAMRFGVALDLWAKENLVEFAEAVKASQTGMGALRQAVAAPAPEPAPEPTPEPAVSDAPQLNARQRGKMFALFTQKGIPESEQLAGIAAIIQRPIESRTAMTSAEFDAVVARLEALPDAEVSE